MKKNKNIFSFLDVSIMIIACSLVMCFLGAALVYKHLGGINFTLLEEDPGIKELLGAYNNLLDNYYDSLDKQDLINGAIAGMYEVTGDPYTTYLDQNSSNSLDESLNGQYKGIGVEMMKTEDGKMQITNVFDDTPAKKAGLKVGDVIIKVNGTDVTAENQNPLIEKIKSESQVELTIIRNGAEEKYTVSSANIMKPALKYQMLSRNDKNVGYIKLEVFSDTADIQFENALSKLESSGIESLILDLRGNSGGYLQVAENIAEMFLQKGKVIYSLKSKTSSSVTKDETNEKRSYNVAVLINGGSASASEILASALKYSYGAKLVGTRSYGKGKVQERATLTNGTSVKFTTAEWLTPEGNCIDGIGLEPDELIDLITDGTNYDLANPYTDSQIIKALETLVG